MIYILEDDASIRKLVVYTIQSQGMEAEGFERPSQFWEALERRTPDLLLLDIMLPEEDGLEILQKLRKKKETKNIPIAMLTAKGSEYDVVKGALIDYKRLGLVGGVLKKYGEVVAFEIGEPLNDDTFVVHFEKAYADVQGAYPMINKQFVLHECQGYKYVNREEDDGEEGLRKAKLSYHPDILLEKYNAYKIG